MSSRDYLEDNFEQDSTDEKKHLLKLSIDLLSVKDFSLSANVTVQYTLQLLQSHTFKSSAQTPVNQNQEVKLNKAFASYEFQATKTELFQLLNDANLNVKVIHSDKGGSQSDIGTASVQMKEILQAPLKKTPQAVIRVSDQYTQIKDQYGSTKGLLRCILYLEDLGEVANQKQTTQPTKQVTGQENLNPNSQQQSDYQAVWQLEIWKRAEEAKFKAYLKQKEIERIEEITYTWKSKEVERDRQFNESLAKVSQLESKLRQKASDLERREQRIIQLEEELKQKLQEVGRQLTVKEEEILGVKKRFKEEKMLLENDKKRLTTQLEDNKSRLQQAENSLYSYKKEVDESPLSVLRNELAQKNLEINELDNKLKTANEQKEEFRKKFEQVKKDMITLKKTMDRERSETLTKQAEEIDKLRNEIRNKQAQEEERREINSLKMQLSSLTQKLVETQKSIQQPTQQIKETINDRVGTYNPFYQQNTQQLSQNTNNTNIFLDNYAQKQQSPTKQTYGAQSNFGGVSMNTELERLMKERQDLLVTGCYTPDDPLIQELDRQIRTTQLRIQ